MCPVLLESINLAWTFHWNCNKTSKILVSDSIWVLTDLNFFKFLLYQIRFNCQTVKPWTFNFKTFFLDITKNFTVAFVIILLRSSFHALVVSCKYFFFYQKSKCWNWMLNIRHQMFFVNYQIFIPNYFLSEIFSNWNFSKVQFSIKYPISFSFSVQLMRRKDNKCNGDHMESAE